MRLWTCRRRNGHTIGLGMLAALAVVATSALPGIPGAAGAVSATTPWALMKTPYLFGSQTRDTLSDVSCPTATLCLAVGTIGITSSFSPAKPLVEEWTGGTTSAWKSLATTGLPTGKETNLFGISCGSPTYCMVLGTTGTSESSQTDFTALWNGGSTWRTVTLASIPTHSGLISVSCVSTNCMAVGYTFMIQNGAIINTMLAQYWNGLNWTISLSGTSGALDSVSCFSATQCLAVGASTSGVASIDTNLAEYFDNGTWTAEPPPNPYTYLTSNADGLLAVNCETEVQPATCMAGGVGTYNDDEQEAMSWNVSTGAWTVSLPASGSLSGPFGRLVRVSCATTTWCVAANTGGQAPIAWDGSTWTPMNITAVDGNSTNPANPFDGVTCPSSTFCVAVGMKRALVGQQPEIASWGTVP